jgi:HlyD family secretion protein
MYTTAPVERGSIATVVRATGIVNPISTVDVSSQLSGRIADVLVSFNDTVKLGQPLGRLDPGIFAARVQEARASLKIAKGDVQVQRASLSRANAALASARMARTVTEENLIGLKAKLEETERQLQRKLDLTRTASVSLADLSKTQTQRDAEAAEVRAMAEQVKMRREAIIMAEAEIRMTEAILKKRRLSSRRSKPASSRQSSIWRARSCARRSTASSSSVTSIQGRPLRSVSRQRPSSRSPTTSVRWRSMARSTKPILDG